MLNQQIIIYAHQYQAPAVVYAVQHDTGRTLTFVPGDFQIPAGATAQLWCKTPSGVLSFAAGTVSGQEITAALTEYNLAEAGNNLGQLQISADGDYIKTFSFILRVQEEVNGEELTPEEVTLLEQAIAEMQAEISDQLAAFEDELDTKVDKTTEINGHALDQDVTLTPEDIGAATEDTEINGHPLTGDIDLTPGDIGAVPDTLTVNNFALDENITLHAVDIPFTPTPDIPEMNVENAINAAVGLMSEAHEDLIYTNTGTTSAVGDYTLTEDVSGYQYLDLLFNFQGEVELRRIPVDDGRSFKMRFSNLADSESSKFFGLAETNLSFSGTTMTIELNKYLAWPSGASEPELRTDGRPYVVTVMGVKYDAIGGPGGGVPIVIDDALSPNSTNPVQNKTIYSALRSAGITEDIKTALLNCFEHVAWIGDDGQQYYDALEAALYNIPLIGISADFDPTATIHETDTLDDLRQYLTVTALYGDGTTDTVSEYELSGTLEAGTNTITVTYRGQTTTFTVTIPEIDHITATYTASGTVYWFDSLDYLKEGLVVEAVYTDSSSDQISADDYTLSGSLTAGTSTITVTFGAFTTTFTVTVDAGTSFKFSDGDLTRVACNACEVSTNGQVLFIGITSSYRRRVFALLRGEKPYKTGNTSTQSAYSESSQDSDWYPIPVPPNATGITATITPSSQFIYLSGYKRSNGIYTRTVNQSWGQGTNSATFEAGAVDVFAINCKYNSAGTTYPVEPTELVITFT